MKVHSAVGLVTNSSSETYSFSALGRSQSAIDALVEHLWLEYIDLEENHDFLASWWNNCDWDYTGRRPAKDVPFSREALIAHGAPISFHIDYNGAATLFTTMDNETVSDEFARFVVERSNSNPMISGQMREICVECIRMGRNVCPPCRL